MPAISVILGLMPLIQSAAQVVTAFAGDDDDRARQDQKLADAFDVITSVAPLIETFTQGGNVTEADVREALDGYDDALAAFDAEIARQQDPATARSGPQGAPSTTPGEKP